VRDCRIALLLTVVLLALGGPAHADMIFTANLTHSQESPPTPDRGFFGTAIFDLNDARTALSFTVTVNGIDVTGTQTPDTSDNLVAAHIHGGAPAGMNASVVWGFFGMPFNAASPSDVVMTPFPTGAGGTFTTTWLMNQGNGTTLTDQLPNLLGGLTYINFHTVANPGGEIRGQILPVPEPATITLLGLGALGVISYGWRRRK
jgi:hypothetical protein